jgi:hypothetical protein
MFARLTSGGKKDASKDAQRPGIKKEKGGFSLWKKKDKKSSKHMVVDDEIEEDQLFDVCEPETNEEKKSEVVINEQKIEKVEKENTSNEVKEVKAAKVKEVKEVKVTPNHPEMPTDPSLLVNFPIEKLQEFCTFKGIEYTEFKKTKEYVAALAATYPKTEKKTVQRCDQLLAILKEKKDVEQEIIDEINNNFNSLLVKLGVENELIATMSATHTLHEKVNHCKNCVRYVHILTYL